MTVAELLAKHGIKLASTAPGRHYTTCPQCSARRASKEHRAAKVLGVTIEADGKVRWGCNHCDLTGPQKGSGKGGNGGDEGFAATYDYTDADGVLLFQKVRNPPGREQRFWLRRPDGKGGWINGTKGVNTEVLYHARRVLRGHRRGPNRGRGRGRKGCRQPARARHHRDLQRAWRERARQAAKVDEGA